jgi:DNA-binding LacI/PurR family transcriptional regulator
MSKRVTANDIAKLAGVSRTTVSFVLNGVTDMRISEDTRQRVLDAAKQLNYHPDANARRMVSGRTHVIGFVVRENPEQVFTDHFLTQLLNGLSHSTAANGYRMLFEAVPPALKRDVYSGLIRERHVDGIVLSAPMFGDKELLRLHEEGTPIVLIGQLPETDIPFVDVDNVGGGMIATQHLIDLGHRHIGLITNSPVSYSSAAARLEGYHRALSQSGIDYDESNVRYGNMTPCSGNRAMQELLALVPRPTAVFVASDTVALGAIQAIRQQGLRIPEDISLIGFDDLALVEFIEPPLTTVHVPAYDIGRTAAELLIQITNNEADNLHVILQSELVVRKSTQQNGPLR